MKRLVTTFILTILPSLAWSSFQPISGSTVTVVPYNNGNLPVQVNSSTVGVVLGGGSSLPVNIINSTVSVVGISGGNIPTQVNSSTVGVVNGGADLNVKLNSLGAGSGIIQVGNVSGSTITVGYQNGMSSVPVNVQNTVTITGSISNTGFNVNNTPAVTQSGSWNVGLTAGQSLTNSTFTIVGTTVGVQGQFADNGVAAGTNRDTVLPGIYQTDYLNGTAATQGRNAAQSVGTDGLLWTTALPSMRPASYEASTNTISVASNATDITALCGNGTNTVLVYGLRVSCTQTTAGNVSLTVLKRSSAYTGAWSTMTATPEDSNYTLVQSSAIWFTANPTPGTLVGHLDNYKLGCMASATASPNDLYIAPASWRMKPIVLRGATQCVAVNLEGATVSGGAFTGTWEWIETKTITP